MVKAIIVHAVFKIIVMLEQHSTHLKGFYNAITDLKSIIFDNGNKAKSDLFQAVCVSLQDKRLYG